MERRLGIPQLRSNSSSSPARLPPPARILPQPGFSLSTLPAPSKRKGTRPYGRVPWFQEAKHIASKTSSVPLVRRYARRGFGAYSSSPPGIAFALEHPRLAFALQLQHAAVSALGLLTQLCRASLLHHTTAFEHHNLVGIVNRAHAMCDNEYRLALK